MSMNTLALVQGPADVDYDKESGTSEAFLGLQGQKEFSKEISRQTELLKTVDTLDQAGLVYAELQAGARIHEVMASTANVHAFGIGHMLFNALRKNLCSPIRVSEMLNMVYDLESAAVAETQIGRHRFIARMRQAGLILPGTTDRNLKPAGTTPCFRSLRTLFSERTNLPFDEIISESRKRNIVRARFQAIWVMRSVCGHSLATIGQHMGNRDHTTILNSINKVAVHMQTDVGYRREVDALCESADTIGVLQNRNLMIRSTSPISS